MDRPLQPTGRLHEHQRLRAHWQDLASDLPGRGAAEDRLGGGLWLHLLRCRSTGRDHMAQRISRHVYGRNQPRMTHF